MALEILIDRYGISERRPDMVVSDSESYRRVRVWLFSEDGSIREGLVLVTSPVLAPWFDDLIGREDVQINILHPATELQRLLQVRSLPDWLSQDPQAIVSEKLLEAARNEPIGKTETPVEWVARVKLGKSWARAELFDPEHLEGVIRDTALGEAGDTPLMSLLRQQRLQHWAQQANRVAGLPWLAEDPYRRSKALVVSRALARYPVNARHNVLRADGLTGTGRDDALAPPRLEATLSDNLVPLADEILGAQAKARIKATLDAELGEQDGLVTVCGLVSGYLAPELQALTDHIELQLQRCEATTPEEADAIRRAFARNPAAKRLLKRINELEQRPIPEQLPLDASWAEARQWLTHSYLPYYSQRALLGKVDETEPYARGFEDWLITNYWHLTKTPDCFVGEFAEAIRAAAQRGPVLAVIIDGLPWEYHSAIVQHAQEHGFFAPSHPALVLSPIPSITRVAKPTMLSGGMPSQVANLDESSATYQHVLESSLKGVADSVIVANDQDGDVHSLLLKRRAVSVFMHNGIDADVHRALPESHRREKIMRQISSLVETIGEATRSVAQSDPHFAQLTVIIGSDHGYTVLPPQTRVIPLPDGVDDDHRRVAYGRFEVDEKAVFVPEPPGEYFMDEAVGIARGYCALNSRPHGAAHGGMTPQELCVPLVTLQLHAGQAIELLDLALVFDGEIRRGRSDNALALRVVNPNRYGITVTEIALRLTKPITELPVTMPPGQELDIEILVDASQVAAETVELTGAVEYEYIGERRSQRVSERLPTVGAAVAKTDFEAMFDDI